MTITSTETEWQYAGDGSTKSFPFTNKAFSASDLRVYVGGTLQSTGYTVAGLGETAGGAVTFAAAPSSGAAVLIVLEPGGGQGVDYVANDAFPAESHEGALDLLTVRVLALEATQRRTLLIDEATGERTLAPLPAASARADKAMAFDAAGQPTFYDWPYLYREDAEKALALAEDAYAKALTAISLVNAIGAVTIPDPARFTIEAGQQDYALGATWPAGQTNVSRYTVIVDGVELDPLHYEIVGSDGRTLRLLRPVVDDPSITADPPELPSGVTMSVRLVVAGLTSAAFTPKSILASHLSDASVEERALQDGAVSIRTLASDLRSITLPIAGVFMWIGSSWPPPGIDTRYVLPLQGQLLARTEYPALSEHQLANTANFPGSTSTHVKLPDMRNNYARGAGGGTVAGSFVAAKVGLHAHNASQTAHFHDESVTKLVADSSNWTWVLATKGTSEEGLRVRQQVTVEKRVSSVLAPLSIDYIGDEAGGNPSSIGVHFVMRVK